MVKITRSIMFGDKMEKHGFTEERMRKADRDVHLNLKRMYGLEYLDFYKNKSRRYCCRYVSNPEDFDYDAALDNDDLIFLLNALSMQQGKIFFEDYGKECVGIDALKELYLPMRLAML